MRKLIAACAVAAAMVSCGRPSGVGADGFGLPSGFSSFTDVGDDGWPYNDTLRFVTPRVSGELRVAVRHSVAYPYSNLWLEVTRPGSDSLHIIRDTVHLELADAFGLWRGNGVGPTRQAEAVVARSVSLDSGATVSVRHIMRLDTLPAIEQAGIFVIH